MSEKTEKERDYPAIGAVFVALIVLMVAGYYLIREFNTHSIIRQVQSLTRLLHEFTPGHKTRQTGVKQIKKKAKQVQKAKRLVRRGYDLYIKHHFSQALESYDDAIKLDVTNPEAFYWRGRAFVKMKQFEPAINDFKTALKLNPRYSEACDNLGWLYMLRNDDDQSIYYLNQSLKIKPKSGWTYYTRGQIYFKKGDKKKALADAERACKFGYQKGCTVYEHYKNR